MSHVVGDEAEPPILAARVLDHRIVIDRERVADARDPDLLIERVLVDILGQDPPVPFAVGYLSIARCPVGNVRFRGALDVADHAVEYLRDIGICRVVGGNNVTRRRVLPLVVGDLLDVLRETVDRQGRAINAPVRPATGFYRVLGPLVVIVRVADGKLLIL